MPSFTSASPLGTAIEAGELASAVQTDIDNKGEGHIAINIWSPDTVTQGTWVVGSHASAYFGGYLKNTSVADADECSWEVYLGAGTYTIKTIAKHSPAMGIGKIQIDGTDKHTFDCYVGSETVDNVQSTTSITVSTSGIATITLKVDGKNGSSSAYNMQVQGIQLYRTA